MSLVRKFPHGVCPTCRLKVQMEPKTKILLWHLHECTGDPNEIFKKDSISSMQRELMNKMCDLAQMEKNAQTMKENIQAHVKPKNRFEAFGVDAPKVQAMPRHSFKKRR